jgi:hypothetical protein
MLDKLHDSGLKKIYSPIALSTYIRLKWIIHFDIIKTRNAGDVTTFLRNRINERRHVQTATGKCRSIGMRMDHQKKKKFLRANHPIGATQYLAQQ